MADGEDRDVAAVGEGCKTGEEAGLAIGAGEDAVLEEGVDGIEDDEAGLAVGADGLLELVGVAGKAEREDVLGEGRTDAVDYGDVLRVGAGGDEAVVESGAVLGGGEDGAGGRDFAAGVAADGREGAVNALLGERVRERRQGGGVGAFGGGVVGPGSRNGEAGGEVGREQGFADGGVADEEGKGADGQALGPEPAEAGGGGGAGGEEAEGGARGAGGVVVAGAGHDRYYSTARRGAGGN